MPPTRTLTRSLTPLVALVVATTCIGPSRADRLVAAADLAVDQVTIKGGPRLLGAILGREADGTLAVAVGRAWLKKSHSRFFEQALRDETAETRAALTELLDRISDWRKARAAETELDFFLTREAQRVEKELNAAAAGTRDETAPFMVVDVPRANLERVVELPPQRKCIAHAAWREGLADVETRSTTSLARELKQKKIEPSDDPDALFDLLPPRRQNGAQWAARRAIVEYRFLKPLDFQGTGDVVVRTGDGAKAGDLGQLFAGLVNAIGGDPLVDLLDPSAAGGNRNATVNEPGERWLAAAVKIAESENAAGFRVTRVDQNSAARRIAVETRFVARLEDGSWKTVWQRTETADASKPRPDVEQQIEKDPRIRAALEAFKSLGGGGQEQIKLAIRTGAATQEAQKAADSRFFEFRDRCLTRLDGPVLRVAPRSPAPAAKTGRK